MDRHLTDTIDHQVNEAWSVLRLCLCYGVAGVVFLGLLRFDWITLPFHPLAAKIVMVCSAAQLVIAAFGTLKLQQLLKDREVLVEELTGEDS